MTELLLRLFVRNHQNTNDPAVRSAVGKLAGITGIVCNVLLFLGKLAAGLLAGSISIMADALNNLSDAASSVVTLLGFRMAQQPADADHPYGHARYEYLSGLVVSALILLIGGQLAKSSVQKLLHPETVELTALTFVILAASVAVKLWMYRFFGKLGKKIRSDTLRATSVDSRNDVISSLAVLAGCLIQHLRGVNVDGFVGMAVAVFILCSGIRMGRETVSPLLGKQADGELVARLSALVLAREQVLGIHDLLVHDYGPGQCYASVHAELSAEEDVLSCHEVIDGIEREALEKLNVHLVIHYDPVVNDPRWREMRSLVEGIVQSLHPRLSIHDFRIVEEPEKPKLVFDLAVPYSVDRQGLQEEIEKALAAQGKHYTTVICFDAKT